jgi:hypothetical protein
MQKLLQFWVQRDTRLHLIIQLSVPTRGGLYGYIYELLICVRQKGRINLNPGKRNIFFSMTFMNSNTAGCFRAYFIDGFSKKN